MVIKIPESEIRKRAGEKWLKRGGGRSSPEEQKRDWDEAERELREERARLQRWKKYKIPKGEKPVEEAAEVTAPAGEEARAKPPIEYGIRDKDGYDEYGRKAYYEEKGKAKWAGKLIPPWVKARFKPLILIFIILCFAIFSVGGFNLWTILIAIVIFLCVITYMFGWSGLKVFLKMTFTLIVVAVILFAIFSRTNIGKAVISKLNIGPSFEKLIIAGELQAAEIKSQITGLGEWKNTQATERVNKEGVEITEIESKPGGYLPDEEIVIIGRVRTNSLEKESSTVEFGCDIYKDKKWERGTVGEELRTINPGEEVFFGVGCNLGIYGPNFEEVTYPKVRFTAKYNKFPTRGYLKLYTISKERKDVIRNPFQDVNDRFLDKNAKTTISTYDEGPLKIAMNVPSSQPLTTDETYLLKVSVEADKIRYDGNLTDGTFELKYPADNIEFANNKRSKFCTEKIKLKRDTTLLCDFKLKTIEEDLSFITIEAEAIYDFEFMRESTVTIGKEEASEVETIPS